MSSAVGAEEVEAFVGGVEDAAALDGALVMRCDRELLVAPVREIDVLFRISIILPNKRTNVLIVFRLPYAYAPTSDGFVDVI